MLDKKLLKKTKPKENFKANYQVQQVLDRFKIKELPTGVFERLAILNNQNFSFHNHWKDSVEIADIINKVNPGKTLELASLLHDIGKTGPVEATQLEQQAFVDLFGLILKNEKNASDLTLESFLEKVTQQKLINSQQASQLLQRILRTFKKIKAKRLDKKFNKNTRMGSIWTWHIYWGADILKQIKLSTEIKEVINAHHLLDGDNPDRVNCQEIEEGGDILDFLEQEEINKAKQQHQQIVWLTLIDKYQAFRKRSNLSHEETIDELKKLIHEKLVDDLPKTKQLYLKIITKIENKK